MSDGHRSGRSTGRVSRCKSTELKRCNMTEMRWNMYEVSLTSPVWTQIRQPSSEIKFGAVEVIIINIIIITTQWCTGSEPGQGRCASCLKKLCLSSSELCTCGDTETVSHIVDSRVLSTNRTTVAFGCCRTPSTTVRSASRGLLNFPRYNMSNYGRRAFCFAGPYVWNSLPEHIRQSTSIAVFKRSLKTFLLQQISHLAH